MHSTSRNGKISPRMTLNLHELTVSSLFRGSNPDLHKHHSLHSKASRQVRSIPAEQRTERCLCVCLCVDVSLKAIGWTREQDRKYSRNTGLCHVLKRPECDPVHTELRPFVRLFTKKTV